MSADMKQIMFAIAIVQHQILVKNIMKYLLKIK